MKEPKGGREKKKKKRGHHAFPGGDTKTDQEGDS